MADLGGIIAYVGLGSNMGEPRLNCEEALDHLRRISGVKVCRCSSFFRTEPVGPVTQEWFINAVCELRVSLSPRELFCALQAVEKRMGRQRLERWGPRLIDLDILFYGQLICQDEDLLIPHPELHKRRFVLTPLMELAPYLIHPAFGVSISGLMDRLEDDSVVEAV